MKLIVGLGNPGASYEDTRHNIGFMVVEKLARELGNGIPSWSQNEKFKAFTLKIGDTVLVKPVTFMNNSGFAVDAVMKFYKLDASDVWVVHDDLDLPMGKIRIRDHGSSAGHNGVQSLITHMGTDKFVRFRMGIGQGKEGITAESDKPVRHRTVISYVLSKFPDSEAGALKHLVKNGEEAVRIALTDGIDKAMNRFN